MDKNQNKPKNYLNNMKKAEGKIIINYLDVVKNRRNEKSKQFTL